MAFPTKPLSECARLASGGTPSKSNPTFWGGPIAWLTPKDMFRFDGTTQDCVTRAAIGNGTREASEDSLFIAVRGMSLHNEIRVVRPKRKMAFNQDIKAITPVAAVDGRFLYYALLAKIPELLDAVEAAGHGTGVLPTDKLNSLPIPDLPLPEQRAIAATLGALDDKIALNRKMNATLEAMARALFRDWFVTFGPTRAKMEGRAPYLSPDLWSLFPDRLDDDGKPEGWEEKPLTDFFSIIGGGTPKTTNPDFWDGPIPWFSVTDTPSTGSVFVTDTEKTITEAGLRGSSARLVPKGTTIISARGTVGKLAVTGRDMTFNQSCYGLIGVGAVGDCATYLIAQNMVARLQAMAHGSVFSTITRQTFESLSQPLPSAEILAAFEVAVSPLFNRILANVNESRTLAQTRDLLLPRLMSGELRVADAARAVEAAL